MSGAAAQTAPLRKIAATAAGDPRPSAILPGRGATGKALFNPLFHGRDPLSSGLIFTELNVAVQLSGKDFQVTVKMLRNCSMKRQTL